MARKTLLSSALRGAEDMVSAAERMRRLEDPTLPADSGDKGAGPLRTGQRRSLGTGATRTGLTRSERKLRDEFYGLTKSARRAEQVLGEDSKFAPFFAAQERLERKASEVDQPEDSGRDPTIIRKRTPSEPPPDKTVIIDGKRYKRGDTDAIETARREERVKQKLLNRPRSGGDEAGMKVGGLKTRKKRKTAEAYKKYLQRKAVKGREEAARNQQSEKRKRITESMSAAKGGLVKTGHTDYRKKGMFYVGGMSAKTTPINKGKKK